MDSNRFDRLAKSLSTVDTRRGLLHALSALPLASSLAAIHSEETPAKGRREKRTDRPRQDQNPLESQRKTKRKTKRKKKRQGETQTPAPGCQPASTAQTCAGLCGPVVNNCGVTVDCTGACGGCCDGTTCHIDDDSACGIGGGSCTPCTGPGETCGGGNPSTPGVCGCTATTCSEQGRQCGPSTDGCGNPLDCGPCLPGQYCTGNGECFCDPVISCPPPQICSNNICG